MDDVCKMMRWIVADLVSRGTTVTVKQLKDAKGDLGGCGDENYLITTVDNDVNVMHFRLEGHTDSSCEPVRTEMFVMNAWMEPVSAREYMRDNWEDIYAEVSMYINTSKVMPDYFVPLG